MGDQKGQTKGQTFPVLGFRYFASRPPVKWVSDPSEIEPWDWTRKRLAACRALHKESDVVSFFVKAQPTPPMDYSVGRLARVHPYLEVSSPQEFPKQAERIQFHLYHLGKQARKEKNPRCESKFGNMVLELVRGRNAIEGKKAVEGIGLLDPHGTADNFFDWWKAAVKVHFFVTFLGEIKFIRSMKKSLDWEMEESPDREEVLRKFEREAGVTNHRVDKESGFILCDLPTPDLFGSIILNCTNEIRSAIHKGKEEGVDDIRIAIARYYFLRHFYARANGHIEFQGSDGWSLQTEVVATVGAYDWALFELARLYGSTGLKPCKNPSCGILFDPHPSNSEYCTDRCYMAGGKRNQREKKKAEGLTQA